MKFEEFYKTLSGKKYYLFTSEDVLSFYPREKKESLKKLLYRWKGKGFIRALKRDFYELIYPEEYAISDMHIANRLYAPSYVSLETALSHYSVIPEVSMAVTSITTKPTRKIRNLHGLFIYRTIKKEAFGGYYVERQGDFDVLIAEPEKALIDFVHFKTFRGKKRAILGEERMDKNIIAGMNKKKLEKYAKQYNIDVEEVIYADL